MLKLLRYAFCKVKIQAQKSLEFLIVLKDDNNDSYNNNNNNNNKVQLSSQLFVRMLGTLMFAACSGYN